MKKIFLFDPFLALVTFFSWPRKKVRALYAWMLGWAQTPQAEKALGTIAFAESSFFPIPPDPLLIALIIAHPAKFLRYASICTLSSVFGGAFGYFIGAVLFSTVGQWVVSTYHLEAAFMSLEIQYNQHAFLTVFAAAFTPIPYKIITIAAGVFHVNFLTFMVASFFGRGMRFFSVGFFMHHFGKKYKDSIERYIDIFSLAFVAILIIGFIVVKKMV